MKDGNEYRWEYSSLSRFGNFVWTRIVDPLLRTFAGDDLTMLRRLRGLIQVIVLVAALLAALSVAYNPSKLLTTSGLLFDIAGVLRLFLLEELTDALSGFKPNKYGNLPSVAMRELIMPEAVGPYDTTSNYVSLFYYQKRGVLFLFIGFALQLIGGLVG